MQGFGINPKCDLLHRATHFPLMFCSAHVHISDCADGQRCPVHANIALGHMHNFFIRCQEKFSSV